VRYIAGGDPDVTVAERGEGAASGNGWAGECERAVKQSGVTLLELLITITIIMVLASVAMPLSKVSGKRARELELRQELRTVRAAIDAFKLDWNRDGGLALGLLRMKHKLTCQEQAGVAWCGSAVLPWADENRTA